LRAVAVIAVLLYHAGVSWLPGGFLGVDVFFVISGYLITMLMLEEHHRTGGLSVKGFYRRRARRLLPALFVLLLAVCVVAVLFYREELARLRPQELSALTYSTNWYLIFTDGSYFDQLGRPLALQHLWSLAVEEQFYLLWPLVMVFLLHRFRDRLGSIALIIGALAGASAIWMALLYEPGADPSRLYYGTDTRLATLLMGGLLAIFWRPSALAHGGVRRHGRIFDVVGLFALAAIILCFVNTSDTSAALYRGGFLGLAVVTALAVAAASHPGTAFGRVLGVGVLTWIGLRSYALYLWHWPVYVVTRPDADVPVHGAALLALRLGVTVLLADLSYRLVERPIRRLGWGRWVRRTIRIGPPGRRRPVGLIVLGATVASLVAFVVVVRAGRPPASEIELSLQAGQQAIAAADGTTAAPAPDEAASGDASPVRAVSADALERATPAKSVATQSRPAPARAGSSTVPRAAPTTVSPTTVATTVPPTTAPPTTPAPRPLGPIVALGDSVMLGAAPQLLSTFGPGTLVDAQVGRTLWPVVGIVASLRAEGRLGEQVVIHLGDNGGVDPDLIARTMASLTDVDRVLWLTVKVPRSWEAGVNATLAAEIPKYPNARILDWKGIATDPAFFYEDGIHLRPNGAAFYAENVKAALTTA
jgi:peptidoglycan/LPS O-acetylase OafA/YrhL